MLPVASYLVSGWHASRFERTDSESSLENEPRQCVYTYCDEWPLDDLPVCFWHAAAVSMCFEKYKQLHPATPAPPPLRADPFVYYLMLGPRTVKIGYTRNLQTRMDLLHTEVQYVVALERGDRKLEQERHRQFAAERRGRRENFHLSDRLKAHIGGLQPQRDELVRLATATTIPAV